MTNHINRDAQIVRAALQRAAMAEELRSEAARSQATKEPSGSESRSRMMARARQSLQGAANIRYLADDPAEAAAILATVPEVEVKPLEWEGSDHDGGYVAGSHVGQYDVYLDTGFGWLAMRDGHDDSWVKYPPGDEGFATSAPAIAACEADCARRVRECLR